MDLMQSLHSFVAKRHGTPIEPGIFDGAIFVADWVAEVTGEDPAKPFRGRYNGFAQGVRLVRKAGYGSLSDLAGASCQKVSGGWMAARIGDVALIDGEGPGCFGIVAGDHIIVASPAGGLDFVELSKAWEVFRPCVA